MDKAIKRGDLVYLNFDPIVGSEQGGPRPAVVVQNDMGNKHAPTVIIAPVTSKNKKSNLPTHVNIAILFKELACLFELESATMPKLRTIKGALKEIKATDPESVMTDYKIRWLIKSGRLRSYAVGTREIIVMESFDDENLLTQESREGCNITQGIKLWKLPLSNKMPKEKKGISL